MKIHWILLPGLLTIIVGSLVAWFLVDEQWKLPISLSLAVISFSASFYGRRQSGKPRISKDVQDYR